MADPTRPVTPAPDDSWPAPDDAAVRRIVEALTAEATPEELADEARYVAAFEALTGTSAAAAPEASRGRRRGRVVLVAAVAALAVTGTAAAVTGTIGRNAPPSDRPPATTSLPAPVTSSSRPGTTTTNPPTSLSPLPTSEPGRTPSSRPASTAPSSRSTPSPTSPTATPNPSSSVKPPPTGALRAWCRSYLQGKVTEDSKKYRVLVEAAGGPDLITPYCTALVAGKPSR